MSCQWLTRADNPPRSYQADRVDAYKPLQTYARHGVILAGAAQRRATMRNMRAIP